MRLKQVSAICILILFTANAEASCPSWFARFLNGITTVPPKTALILHQYQPGEWVHLTTKSNKVASGMILSNSSTSLIIEQSNGELFKAAHRSLKNIYKVNEIPNFNSRFGLDELKAAHKVKLETAALDPSKVWNKIHPTLRREIKIFKNLNREKQKEYLSRVGREMLRELQEKTGSKNFGVHFNLHGGHAHQYSDSGGVFISQGDVTLNYGMGDNAFKVYFFKTENISLDQILGEPSPRSFLGKGRMGTSVVVFRTDSDYFKRAVNEKGITAESLISLDFDQAWAFKQPLSRVNGAAIGIPSTEFVIPPTTIFPVIPTNWGLGKISRDVETLANLRYLQSVIRQHLLIKK